MTSMRTDGLIKSFRADAAIAPHRAIKPGAAAGAAAQASAATDAIMGVHGSLAAVAGAVTDAVVSGYATMEYGATIAAGVPVTCDAQGRAIAATSAGQRLVGFAVLAGVLGDLGTVDVRLGINAVASA